MKPAKILEKHRSTTYIALGYNSDLYSNINEVRKIVFFLLCMLVFRSSQSQTVRTPVNALYTHIGSYTISHADAFSFSFNQAALANFKSFSAGIFSERRFLLQELSLVQVAFALPGSSGNFGLNGSYFGGVDYNEAHIGFAYGRNLGEKISVGAQFNYFNFHARGYGNASTINFEAGVLIRLTEQLNAGLHVNNPTSSRLNKNSDEKLPSIYTAGLSYEPSDKVVIMAEMQKTENRAVSINAGLEYIFHERLSARGGFSSGTSSYFIGAGLALQNFKLHAITSIHQHLGLTPGIMLTFNRPEEAQ